MRLTGAAHMCPRGHLQRRAVFVPECTWSARTPSFRLGTHIVSPWGRPRPTFPPRAPAPAPRIGDTRHQITLGRRLRCPIQTRTHSTATTPAGCCPRSRPLGARVPVAHQARSRCCQVVEPGQHDASRTDGAPSGPAGPIVGRSPPRMATGAGPPDFADRTVGDISGRQLAIARAPLTD